MTGTCTLCGKENVPLTIIDEIDQVCEECLDASFFFCDECGEYYADTVTQHWLTDGRCICDNCIDEFDEDDIEESF